MKMSFLATSKFEQLIELVSVSELFHILAVKGELFNGLQNYSIFYFFTLFITILPKH